MVDAGSSGPYGVGRLSPQRRLIAEAVASMPGAFSVDELASLVRERDPETGVATVYRAVSAMVKSGWLERVGERGGSGLYLRCHAGAHHHHHVICDRCGRVEITGCPVVQAPSLTTGEGFVVNRHEITLYGLCPRCAAEEPLGGER